MSTAIEERPQGPGPELRRGHFSNEYDDELGLDEKAARPTLIGAQEKVDEEIMEAQDSSKPFPIDPNAPEEMHQLTFRALLVGSLLGAVVGASNIYLGLKTGFTFGPQLFGAIFGYAIIKPLSRIVPASGIFGRMFGGEFGPKENCTVQTAATSAGGLGILFVSAVPAMYRLGLLSDLPQQDAGKLIALTVCAGFFGVFFAIPLRKYYIIKQKLTFPTPTATAYTIRALHNGKTGAIAAKKKSRGLLISFVSVFIFKVMTGYAPGILYDWHIGWTLFRLGFTSIIGLENYGWFIEFTPAFFGAGMLSGINASWSFFAGHVLSWGIIAPSLIATGKAVGAVASEEFPQLITYQSLSFKDPDRYVNSPSPRYWLLWPGVLVMLVFSFMEVVLSVGPVWRHLPAVNMNPRAWFRRNNDAPLNTGIDPDDENYDPSPPEDQVPLLWWTTGLAASSVMSCAILATMFNMNVGEAILALILGFLFSFIGVQSSGQTDVNPVSTVAKASQLIFGGISKGAGLQPRAGQLVNLTAGVISAGSAAQSTDMTGDLKTGFLLNSRPKNQFIAQIVGSVVSVFLNVGLFILFTKSAPCILTGDLPCTYGAPSVAAWAAVAVAVTAPKLPIPPSSGYTAIGLAIAAALTVIVKHFFIPRKYWRYIPNWNAIGLAFVVPQIYYSVAMAAGSLFNYMWHRRNPKGHEMYMFAIAAGMLAGEGLGGVFQALLAVAKVDGGAGYGTVIGCPGMEFCG